MKERHKLWLGKTGDKALRRGWETGAKKNTHSREPILKRLTQRVIENLSVRGGHDDEPVTENCKTPLRGV